MTINETILHVFSKACTELASLKGKLFATSNIQRYLTVWKYIVCYYMFKYQKQERYQGTTLYSYLHEFSHPIRSILYIFIKRKVQCKLHYQPLMIELQFFRCGKYFFSQMNSCHWHLTKHFYKTASPYPMHYLIALILVPASQKSAYLNNKWVMKITRYLYQIMFRHMKNYLSVTMKE